MPPEAAQIDEDEHLDDAALEGADGDGEGEPQSSAEAIKVAELMGWKDPKNWKGDPPPGGLKTAEEFLRDVPEVTRNLRQKSERQEGQLNRIVTQMAKLDRRTNAQDVAAASAAAEEAFEAGDFAKAKEILLAAGKAPASDPDELPAFAAFKTRNEWYGVDDEATAYVGAMDAKFAREAGGPANVDPEAHFRKIDAAVKKRFPELFEGDDRGGKDEERGERRRAPLVSRGGGVDRSKRGGNGEITVADLSPAQRKACKTMDVSEKDYVEQFNKLNKAS